MLILRVELTLCQLRNQLNRDSLNYHSLEITPGSVLRIIKNLKSQLCFNKFLENTNDVVIMFVRQTRCNYSANFDEIWYNSQGSS